jgi:tRNA threonylcarbamoyladenosine biosynthesis protein TsaB
VRIGVSVAKTFAWALGIPVVAVSSLEALAYSALRLAAGGADGPAGGLPAGENGLGATDGAKPIWIVPLLDARRGQAYCAVYAAGGADGWEAVIADGIRLFSDWAKELTAMAQEAAIQGEGPVRILFAGETSKFRDTIASLRERVPAGLEIAEAECEIRASAVAELGAIRLANGVTDDVHGLVPNYTQLAEAEVKLLEKERRGGDRSGGVC